MFLAEVKDILKITWTDEDEVLENMIIRAKEVLEEFTGTNINFEKGLAKNLLLDHVRYAYNNSLEFFEENFRKEILRLQILEAQKDYDIQK